MDECFFRLEKLKFAKITQKDVNKAYDLSKKYKLPRKDAIHAAIAIRHKFTVVTRDKHFEKVSAIVDVRTPEEL